ncbi:hypothetical protein M405DRAFT_816065 [Rhizopogon salebrosus TDB-379]|nr:hypothetical protein M405DRAFT_816065 [Rhizopogon salebrosus TDB-379]
MSYQMEGCTAVVRDGENVLRGEPVDDTSLWDLEYVNNGVPGLTTCTLTAVNGEGYLGVCSIKNDEAVYRLREQPKQNWTLNQKGVGFTISQVAGHSEYYWYLGEAGERINIFDSSKEPQSWVFEGPYPGPGAWQV